MKRWLSNCIIGLYLTALSIGIIAHTMKFGSAAHPAMYYFVWDMFCGWSSHEIRYHVIGQGESGSYYELAPGPWGTFMPYGDLDRMHYDVLGNAQHKMALNALKRTDHEPIHRIVILEEVWPKQYNLSDHMWSLRYDQPKDRMSYYWQRAEMTDDGHVISAVGEYLDYLQKKSVADNPRLRDDLHRGQDHFALSPSLRSTNSSND
jgi:hypothetical protein